MLSPNNTNSISIESSWPPNRAILNGISTINNKVAVHQVWTEDTPRNPSQQAELLSSHLAAPGCLFHSQ